MHKKHDTWIFSDTLWKQREFIITSQVPATACDRLRTLPPPICAILGQKQRFFAQNIPRTRARRQNQGKRWLHYTCGLTSPCQRAFYCPSTPQYVQETAQKGAKKPQNPHNVHRHPETKHGPYLGLCGSNPDSEGT